jgi:dTMP kinase
MTGRLIVFEGGEGSGKSTQAALLAERLHAVLTRQPGGTSLGAAIRALLLDPAGPPIDARAEALLMAADRAQHVADVIRPALESGRDVVCDRYAHSSIAYQGFGRGLDPAEITQISGWASNDLWPDVVVLLDVDEAVAVARLGRDLDRFERAGREFHERVREGFRRLAASDPRRWIVVDGSQAIEVVRAEVDAAIGALHAERPTS